MKNLKLDFDSSIMHKKTQYPFFEEIFYRPAANFLTPRIAKFSTSPTLWNVIGFSLGLLGIYIVAIGDFWYRVGGATILIISYILDCVDGQLARGFKLENGFGALLDTSLDSIKESLIFFALAWSYYSQTGDINIIFYLLAILFAQRMFGRTLPRYQILFNTDIENIKTRVFKNLPKPLEFIAFLFSESYRSGTIWIVIFIGIISGQTIVTFIYFIAVMFCLFIFLLVRAYQRNENA